MRHTTNNIIPQRTTPPAIGQPQAPEQRVPSPTVEEEHDDALDPQPDGPPEPQSPAPATGASQPNRNLPMPHEPRTPQNNNNRSKSFRANFKLATLNMKGRSSQLTGPGPTSKWTAVAKAIRTQKLGLIALQETHLSDLLADQVSSLFHRRMTVLNSQCPTNPTGSAGVAFVINKEILDAKDITFHELIPGRAIYMSLKWQRDTAIKLINIYAPNDLQSQPQFWTELETRWSDLRLPHPDFMMGDFNVTEDPLDRTPARPDSENAITALRTCRYTLGVRDSWRQTSPSERAFTFTTTSHTMSRRDRIYSREEIETNPTDWSHDTSSIPSDHKMVSVRFAPNSAPFIGKDRWSWPLGLLHNKELNSTIINMGKELQSKLDNLTNNDRTTNAQTVWQELKDNMKREAAKAAKKQIPKINSRLNALKKDLKETYQRETLDASLHTRTEAEQIEREIEHLEKKRYQKDFTRSQAMWHLKGEKINKYWTRINNPRKPRDLIYRLRNPITQHPVTRSEEMAQLAKEYHEDLQTENLLPPTSAARAEALENALQAIPDSQKLEDPLSSQLNAPITYTDLEEALAASKLGTAAGPDGIPYEVWKHLHAQHRAAIKENRPSFNVLLCMLKAIVDIQENGVDPSTQFTLGWLVPIYKKKEKDQIKNYRPITLLNTDYKLLTKVLSTHLAKHIHSLVHPDQSGFIPKRSIFDPINLNQSLCAYADYMEENGVIVALDQEKAYDKIDHHYLLETLTRFNLPQPFINSIRSLYNTATTAVLVNGVVSSPFKVTRGVRQGDPLSCLLFNLAIEPLACLLRKSPDLAGFDIPGIREKLIVSLYADDTTVYLSESDSYATLQNILSKWCMASGAKFNLEKTEIIPIGTEEHRERVITSRKITINDLPLAQAIKITPDGNAVRCLGAWIGNNTKAVEPWEPILDKVNATLKRWNRGHPTLDAKRHITQMFAGGMTQFLTAAQGMPKPIETALVKIIREFIWESTAPPMISMARLYAPIEEGGIHLLSIPARNKAIDLMRLKTYLDLTPSRPKWAFLMDAIINTLHPDVPPKPPAFPLTSWSPPTRGPRASLLPFCVTSLLKSAKEAKLTFTPNKLSKTLKQQLPAWFHLGAPPRAYNKLRDHCLKTIHKIGKVKNLRSLSKRLFQPGNTHQNCIDCPCEDCNKDRRKGCRHPHKCAVSAYNLLVGLSQKLNPSGPTQKDGLTLTHHRLEKNARANLPRGDEILFNPSVTTRSSLADCFRVHMDHVPSPLTALRRKNDENPQPKLTAFTDGSCINNGRQDARSGAGVWVADNHPINQSIRVPGPEQSNQTGELAAILAALQSVPQTTKLTIVTDSQYAVKMLTRALPDLEDVGWANIPNAKWLQAAAYHLRIRGAPTLFKWVKGHEGTLGNEQADRLAAAGVNKPVTDDIDLVVPDHFRQSGLKLATLTQAKAYAFISSRNRPPRPRRVEILLDQIRDSIEPINEHYITNRSIWKGCRNTDIRRTIQTFLFKAINGALRIGDFWNNIPTFEHRARCASCNASPESLEHILLECSHPTVDQIWSMAKTFWSPLTPPWPTTTLGTLLGCGSIALPTLEDQPHKKGQSRLLRILLSESLHLIWVLRCERVIQGTQHTPTAIETRWKNKVHHRIAIDRYIATTHPSKILSRSMVYQTWTTALQRIIPDLDPDWVVKGEVLVGMNPTFPVDPG